MIKHPTQTSLIERRVVRLVFLFTVLLFSSEVIAGAIDESSDKRITLIGLGGMGKAVLQCFARHQYEVHAWNRGEPNRKQVQDMGLDHVTVYETVQEAVAATDVTMLVINSAPNLQTVTDLIHSLPETTWKDKTIVNFVNHEPIAAKDLEELMKGLSIHHLAGSIFGVPQTICSPHAVVLVSAPERDTGMLQKLAPSLELLGRLETFSGDVGYGSLIVVGLIQSLYFGMTGFELSLLVLEKYRVPGVMMDRFVELAKGIATSYFPMFFGVVSKSIQEREWHKSYVPAADMLALLKMHKTFFAHMGIDEDIYNNLYVSYLQKTVARDENAGATAVVKEYNTDEAFEFREKEQVRSGIATNDEL